MPKNVTNAPRRFNPTKQTKSMQDYFIMDYNRIKDQLNSLSNLSADKKKSLVKLIALADKHSNLTPDQQKDLIRCLNQTYHFLRPIDDNSDHKLSSKDYSKAIETFQTSMQAKEAEKLKQDIEIYNAVKNQCLKIFWVGAIIIPICTVLSLLTLPVPLLAVIIAVEALTFIASVSAVSFPIFYKCNEFIDNLIFQDNFEKNLHQCMSDILNPPAKISLIGSIFHKLMPGPVHVDENPIGFESFESPESTNKSPRSH